MTLAERMIVMNAGRMEQIGTPEEVYQRPATTFVAGFIGSPPMNLLRGRAEGGRLHRRRAALPLPGPRRAPANWCWACGRSTSSCATPARRWPLRVQALEMLGAERLVYGRSARRSSPRGIDATAPHAEDRRHRATCASARARALVRRGDAARAAPEPATVGHAPWPYPRWIAHRGAGKLAPENTLAAFRLGASHGYRAFECDVKLAADGVPFLLHDATLERTTNGHGCRRRARWSDWRGSTPARWHAAAYAGEPLPRSKRVAALLPRATAMRSTSRSSRRPGSEAETGRRRRRAGRASSGAAPPLPPLFSSFQPAALAAAQAAAPEHAARLAARRACAPAGSTRRKALGCSRVVTHHELMDAAVLAQIHAAGLRGSATPSTIRPRRSGSRRSASTASSPTRSTASRPSDGQRPSMARTCTQCPAGC